MIEELRRLPTSKKVYVLSLLLASFLLLSFEIYLFIIAQVSATTGRQTELFGIELKITYTILLLSAILLVINIIYNRAKRILHEELGVIREETECLMPYDEFLKTYAEKIEIKSSAVGDIDIQECLQLFKGAREIKVVVRPELYTSVHHGF